MAKRFRCPKSNKHVSHWQKKHITGTLQFCSTNATARMSQSRRDDLESIGFMLIYLAKGTLPWIEELENTLLNYEKPKEYNMIVEKCL